VQRLLGARPASVAPSSASLPRQRTVKHWRLDGEEQRSPAANHGDSHRTDRRLHHVRLAVCSAVRDRCRRPRVSLDDHPLRPRDSDHRRQLAVPRQLRRQLCPLLCRQLRPLNFVLYCVVNFVLYCVVDFVLYCVVNFVLNCVVNFVLYCVVNFVLYCVVNFVPLLCRQLRPLLCRQRSVSLHCTRRSVLLRLLLADCRTARQARCRVT